MHLGWVEYIVVVLIVKMPMIGRRLLENRTGCDALRPRLTSSIWLAVREHPKHFAQFFTIQPCRFSQVHPEARVEFDFA